MNKLISRGLLAVTALAIPAGTAVAMTGVASAQGNGTVVSHYNVSYNDPNLGPVNCTGVNQVHNGNVQDSFTCASTSGSALVGVTANEHLTLGSGPFWDAWYSDFNGAQAKTVTGTVSSNDMSYTAVATY
jgi:hypothetical protein